jgi:rod shape determining protein RodA
MNLGLLPVTGIPLPFLSVGGSSLMAFMFSLGVVFSS